jgi:hypothetical protein
MNSISVTFITKTSFKQYLHWAASTCDLSIGVTAKSFLTSKKPGSVTYSIDEPLIYVQSEGRVVYLIRPAQVVMCVICKYNLRGCVIHLTSLPLCLVLSELLFWTVYYSYICICDIPLLSSDLDTNVRLRSVSDLGFCCISTFWWIYICVSRVEFPLLPHGYQFCLSLPFLYMMLKLFRQYGIFVFLFFIILHGDI